MFKCAILGHAWIEVRTLRVDGVFILKSQYQCERCNLCAIVDGANLPEFAEKVFYK